MGVGGSGIGVSFSSLAQEKNSRGSRKKTIKRYTLSILDNATLRRKGLKLLYKRNIYIFFSFVILSVSLFTKTLFAEERLESRWLYVGAGCNANSLIEKDPRFSFASHRELGTSFSIGIDLFSIVSLNSALSIANITDSSPNMGVVYRGYNTISNSYTLNLYIKVSNLLNQFYLYPGIFGGWKYSFAIYQNSTLLFYYESIISGFNLEIVSKKSKFFSFNFSIPFIYDIRKDLEYSFSIGLYIGINLYPVLLFEKILFRED